MNMMVTMQMKMNKNNNSPADLKAGQYLYEYEHERTAINGCTLLFVFMPDPRDMCVACVARPHG